MSTDQTETDEERKRREAAAEADAKDQADAGGQQITDDLARKYDPERLLGMVSRSAGRGQSLDQSIRARYERRFGVDLSHVRIYTGEFAEEFNKQHNAHAVTIGSTGMIMMGGSPERAMSSAAGQALLAHELTHVAQASRGLHRKGFGDGMPFAGEHEGHEHEAEAVEKEVQQAGTTGADVAHELTSKMRMAEALAEKIEEIKARVHELFADAFRHQDTRTGSSRRA